MLIHAKKATSREILGLIIIVAVCMIALVIWIIYFNGPFKSGATSYLNKISQLFMGEII